MGRTQVDDKYQNNQLLKILYLWLHGQRQRYSMRPTPFIHDYYLITSISLFHSCRSTPLGHDSTLSGSYQRVPSLHYQFSSSTHEADNDTHRDAESTRMILIRNWLGLLAWPCQLHTNFSLFPMVLKGTDGLGHTIKPKQCFTLKTCVHPKARRDSDWDFRSL